MAERPSGLAVNWLHLARLGILAAVFVIGWKARAVTAPLLAAYLLMLICLPWRQRMKKRIGGIGATLTCMLLILIAPLALVLPVLGEVDDLHAMLPSADDAEQARVWTQEKVIEPLNGFIDSLPDALGEKLRKVVSSDTVMNSGGSLGKFLPWLAGALFTFLGGALGIASGLILLPIFLFYLLEGAPWLPRLRGELPASWRGSFDRTIPKIQRLLRVYCRARVVVALLKGAIAWVILLVFGLPGAYTLGLMIGVFSLLPVVGALVSTSALLVIAVVEMGMGGLGLALLVYAVTEVLEGYVLLPKLVGRELGMSDFLVILAVLVGGALMGIFGLLIAIPAVAIGRVLYEEYGRPLMQDEPPLAAASAPLLPGESVPPPLDGDGSD